MPKIEEVTPTSREIKKEFRGADLREVPLSELVPNPRQPRANIHPESLLELTASIRQHGVLEPILIAETGDGYKIIAGERRFRAAKVAGLNKIPALVKKIDEKQMLLLGLIENVQRRDLNIYEKAQSFRELAEEFGLTHQQIADKLGLSRASITQAMRLLQLPDEVIGGLAAERITESHGRALLMLKDHPEECLVLYHKTLEEELPSTAAIKLAREMLSGRQLAKKAPKSTVLRTDAETRGMEMIIRERLGADEVVLKRARNGRGSLMVKFSSDEELKRIFGVISGSD